MLQVNDKKNALKDKVQHKKKFVETADGDDARTLDRQADKESNPTSGPTLKDSDGNTKLNLELVDFTEDNAVKKLQVQ